MRFLDGKRFGAGEGNRTLMAGLEDQDSTIELHPRPFLFISHQLWFVNIFLGAIDEYLIGQRKIQASIMCG